MGKRKNGEGTYGVKVIRGYEYKYFRDSDGKYLYGKTAKELDAKIRKKKQQDRITERQQVTNSLFTWGEYCMHWLKNTEHEFTEGTYDDYEQIIIRRIQKFDGYDISSKQLKTLTADMFTEYYKALAEKYSTGSIKAVNNVTVQVLKYGMKKEVIPRIYIQDIKKPKEKDVKVKKKKVEFIDLSDMEILYNEAQKKHKSGRLVYGDGARLLIFIMYSGVRIGEAVALKKRYVDAGLEYVRIEGSQRRVIERDENREPIKKDGRNVYKKIYKNPKTEKGHRTIPLPDRAIQEIKYFYDIDPDKKPDDYVFLNRNGKPFSKESLQRTLKTMLENSNCACKEYTPHSLRHGYGSVLISKGVDIKIVSELLGHSDVAFTYNVYIGVLKEDKINAVRSVFDKKI